MLWTLQWFALLLPKQFYIQYMSSDLIQSGFISFILRAPFTTNEFCASEYGICDIREAWNMNCARNVWHRMVLLTPMYRSTQMSFRCRFRFHREDHFFVKICWISISQSIVPLINSAKNKDSDLKINLRELWICTRPFASFSLIKKHKILLRIQES